MPMPTPAPTPLIRTKTSDSVAEHILEMLFAGELRPGDRIDLDALAERLGVSRVPIREALISLEQDGLVDMPYHRGAFVAALDSTTIREAFELYGLLSGLTSGRVALSRDPALLAELELRARAVEDATDTRSFEAAAREFRRLINLSAAGPRLRGMLRSFNRLLPVASRLSAEPLLEDERQLVQAEMSAIRGQDPEAARVAAITHIRLLGEYAVDTLATRGVITLAPQRPASVDELTATLAAFDRSEKR